MAEKRVKITLSLFLIPYEDTVEIEVTEKGLTIKYIEND